MQTKTCVLFRSFVNQNKVIVIISFRSNIGTDLKLRPGPTTFSVKNNYVFPLSGIYLSDSIFCNAP